MGFLFLKPPGSNGSRVAGDGDGKVKGSGEGVGVGSLRYDDESSQDHNGNVFTYELAITNVNRPILGLNGSKLSHKHNDNKSNSPSVIYSTILS
jgi:hypothetical protein